MFKARPTIMPASMEIKTLVARVMVFLLIILVCHQILIIKLTGIKKAFSCIFEKPLAVLVKSF